MGIDGKLRTLNCSRTADLDCNPRSRPCVSAVIRFDELDRGSKVVAAEGTGEAGIEVGVRDKDSLRIGGIDGRPRFVEQMREAILGNCRDWIVPGFTAIGGLVY